MRWPCSGNIHVFVSPESGVKLVRFYLDNTAASGTPTQTENAAPWDFAGGTASAATSARDRDSRADCDASARDRDSRADCDASARDRDTRADCDASARDRDSRADPGANRDSPARQRRDLLGRQHAGGAVGPEQALGLGARRHGQGRFDHQLGPLLG